jgi:hypothetical protein
VTTQPPEPDSTSTPVQRLRLGCAESSLGGLGQGEVSQSRLWEAVEGVLRRHLYQPDLQAARGLYAALAAHGLHGQPVWPMLVAPPGSMKTDLLAALDGVPLVHLIDCVTPNTFLSGQVKDGKRPATNNSSSLLHRIGPSGIIAYPDFSTVLSMNRTHRASVFADMRRVYDGHLRKEYGTDEDRKAHEWRGRITFAVGTTDEVDRHYSVFQTLGERFVMIRWHRPGGVAAALKAMNQDCGERARDLRQAVHALINGLEKQSPELSPDLQERIAALAEFAVRGRTHIERNGYRKDIEYIPEPEAATRLAQQLAQLAKGSALIGARNSAEQEDYCLVQRVGFDCIPTVRRKLLDTLIRGEKADKCQLPSSTLSYVKEELQLLDLLRGDELSHQARNLLVQAGVL